MIGALLLAGLAACVGDPAPAERAFVELDAPRAEPFVQAAFTVRLRVGIDAAWFEQHVVADTLRDTDLPVRVVAPWFDAPPEGVTVTRIEAGDRRLVLGDGTAAARAAVDEERDGRTFRVVTVDLGVVATEAGSLLVPAPTMHFAHTTRFGFNALGERVPLDRVEVTVPGEPLLIAVRPLPAAGRPPAFTGAVGEFTVTAQAPTTAVRVGDSLRLVLRIEGTGNLATFDPPSPPLGGFHLRGMLDDRGSPVRTITWDLAPLHAGVAALPAVPFAWFDPAASGTWRTTATDAIPIRVTGAPAEVAAPVVEPEPAPTVPRESDGPAPWQVALFVVVVVAAAAVVGRRSRALESAAGAAPRPDADRPRPPDLGSALEAGRDAGDAFADWLAAHLGCTRAAVIGPGLEWRLRTRGVPAEDAVAAAAVLERLVAARYGGAPVDDPSAVVREASGRLGRWLGDAAEADRGG